MLEVEFVFFEFSYFLVCKFFVKLFLICWSSFGLVKILMVVIVRVFFWDKVKGWVVGLFVKRCYDWLKRIMKWLDFKEFFIMWFIRSWNRYKSIKDVIFYFFGVVSLWDNKFNNGYGFCKDKK